MRSRLATPSSRALFVGLDTVVRGVPSMFWRLPDMIRMNHKVTKSTKRQVTVLWAL